MTFALVTLLGAAVIWLAPRPRAKTV
jgi:hypothetical protein